MGTERRVLAEGLEFPEGPIYMGEGSVIFTEINGQCLKRFGAGTVTLVARTGGGANGAALGADGFVYVANNGGLSVGGAGYWNAPDPIAGRIQRVSPSGEVTDFATDLPGSPPNRPNDLCFGPDGKLYFTDPHNWEDFSNLGPGRICRADASGGVELLHEGLRFPNGIAFGPDGRTLFVAETVTQKIQAFPLSDGGLGPPREFAALPEGFPDGMCFSAEGDLYVAAARADGVLVFNPEGGFKEKIPTEASPTNCCIGDGTLYVTLSGSGELLAFDLDVEALPLFDKWT